MRKEQVDIAIIGGGPAGLAAAVRAKELGVKKVMLIERDADLGGILNQCIHDGFGLIRFKKQLSGCEYAQRFVDMVHQNDIQVMLGAMVLELHPDKTLLVTSEKEGLTQVDAGAVILAMGCRERTRSQVGIMGSRPAGVLTAGAVQKYINVEGFLPGKRAVILGSGDIGLIMARRMTLEGIKVEGVYEVMPSPGGLRRNVVQCLEDYGIPLHLSTTVTAIHGKERITGVTVAQVDAQRKPIKRTERQIACDLLVLSVGLIPENELSRGAGIMLSSITRGPLVDDGMMTSVPGIFAAGNVAAVFDLVDYVSATGERAAASAAAYLKKGAPVGSSYAIEAGENVSFVLPQSYKSPEEDDTCTLYLRVRKPMTNTKAIVKCGEKIVAQKHYKVAAPPEMMAIPIQLSAGMSGGVTVDVLEEEGK